MRIRIDQMAADHVRDRFWHESQECVESPDGRLGLRLRVSDLLEVERLVLQWGGRAEALEPAELRVRLARAASEPGRAHA